MTEALVVASDKPPGEALMALPTICEYAKQYDKVKLAMENHWVASIADLPRNVELVRLDPNDSLMHENLKTIKLERIENLHPTQQLLRQAGFPYHDVPRPRVNKYKLGAPRYDVIFAPWSRDKHRSLTESQAQEVVYALKPLSVCVIGGSGDPIMLGADGMRGFSFPWVISLMDRAGCVVTVDSFPSRLAHAVGHPQHILFYTDTTPVAWAAHPGATIVATLDSIREVVNGFYE